MDFVALFYSFSYKKVLKNETQCYCICYFVIDKLKLDLLHKVFFVEIKIMEDKLMKKLRLKDEYPWYNKDEYIEIPDEIYEAFKEFSRMEHRQAEKIRYHKACYSLDLMNGIETDIINLFASPDEILERQELCFKIQNSILKLLEKQAERIIKHYYENMSVVMIADSEDVDESSVRDTIRRGLSKIKRDFEQYK